MINEFYGYAREKLEMQYQAFRQATYDYAVANEPRRARESALQAEALKLASSLLEQSFKRYKEAD
jgi:hypothetical protein